MENQQKPIVILGSSYRCGSTLVQRLLNCATKDNGQQCFILGEVLNNVLASMCYNIKDAQKAEVIEMRERQKESFKKDANTWTANFGPPMEMEGNNYANFIYSTIYPPQGYPSIKYYGFKYLFHTRSIIDGLVSFLTSLDPHYIILSRNLQDSFSSYIKQPWRGITFNEFADRWSQSIDSEAYIKWAIENNNVGYESHRFTFLNYEDINLESITTIFRHLDLDEDNIQRVLDKKIGYMDNNNELTLTDSEIRVIDRIGRKR